MALEDILDSIRREAEEQAAEIIATAESRADALLAEARLAAREREEELASSLDDRIRDLRRRHASRAQIDAARERRNAREEVFLGALEQVSNRLARLREEPRYESILAQLLDEATATLPDPTLIRVDPADVDLVRRLATERGLASAVEPMSGRWGGVELVADGKQVRNDLAARLTAADEEMRLLAGELVPELRGDTR